MTNLTGLSATGDADTASDIANNTTTFAGEADTATTDLRADLTEEWLTIKLPRDEAVAYLKTEILEWFKERGIDIAAEERRQEREALRTKHKHIPWYLGGFHGVRADRAIHFHYKLLRESFRSNPYGLNARWYFFILASQLVFMLGNILAGTADAMEKKQNDELHVYTPVIRGAISALPIVWMFTLFLYPPLIANVRDQFTAMGHYYDDE